MKIAIITDDGNTVSQHFGRAQFYLVASIDKGVVINREMREKIGHGQFAGAEPGGHVHEHRHEHHGADEASHQKHAQMANSIADCEVVICGGMGRGAYESMARLNIRPIVTNLQSVDEVLKAFIDNTLVDHAEMLH